MLSRATAARRLLRSAHRALPPLSDLPAMAALQMNAASLSSAPRALLAKDASSKAASTASAPSISWRSFSSGNPALLARLSRSAAHATSASQRAGQKPATWSPVRCNATTTEAPASETFTYQAEVNRLMDLIVHSLYSHREVFLRELVSNASDALDKLRFLSVTDPSLMAADAELAIRIKADPAAGTITITDTGIGMTKEELMDSLGTIAQSGTAKFVQAIKEKQEKEGEVDSNLIGQFGVGFYSAFLVADRVTVCTKSAKGGKQWVWEAEADQSTYTIREDDGEQLARGTSIQLHLKDDQKAEYSDPARLASLVKNYSQFIGFPIYMWQEQTRSKEEEYEEAAKEEGEPPVKKTRTVQEKYFDWVLENDTKPIWVRAPKEVEQAEYNEFFKNTFKEFLDPLAHTHFSTEGEIEFKSLLYVPGMAPFDANDMFSGKTRNIRLYVKRVFISDQFDGELLPRYMAFIKGVVDSNDLPLNVSREILQESRIVRIMRKRLVRKVFDMLDDIAARKDSDGKPSSDYTTFWQSFGRNVKLGCIEDSGNHKRLAPLLRFFSSASEDELISLEDYTGRMKDGQKEIYYIAADTVRSAKSAPFLEKLNQKGLEVLFLVEPIDEVAVTTLQSYKDLKFVDISKEDLDLGDEDEASKREQEKEFQGVCDWMKGVLGDKVAKVQVSQRIASSPCVLVAGKFGWSANMERIMKAQTMGDPQQAEFMRGRRILEINADHPIIKDLKVQSSVAPDSPKARQLVDLLYETAHIASGFPPENPAEFGSRVYEMMALATPQAAAAGPASPSSIRQLPASAATIIVASPSIMTLSQVGVRPPVATATLHSPSAKTAVRATSAKSTSSANVCAVSASAIPKPLEWLEVSGSPFERGCAIGVRFGDKIRDRVAKAPFLHDDMIPFARTGEGAWLLEMFSESNKALYPEYWEELRGMAAGSCVPFDELLLLNLRKEFGPFLPSLNAPATSALLPELASPVVAGSGGGGAATLDRALQYGMTSDDCSDVLLLTDDVAAVGHNEDADYSIVDNTFLVHVHADSGVAFTAYTYAGELPSVAFGFNNARMGFSMDAVPPAPSEVVKGGIGRNFVARSLMESRSIEDAVQRVTGPAVAVGHHYVLMDFAHRRIASVETASHGRHSILELGPNPKLGSQADPKGVSAGTEDAAFNGGAAANGDAATTAEGTEYIFHANAYTRLKLQEKMGPSAHRREATAQRLGAPRTTHDMLKILSNSDDNEYPIFNDGNPFEIGGPVIHTLHSTLFNLDAGKLSIFGGRSTDGNVLHGFVV
ncbi:unnamed protein product [Closterium sp. Yama58-4]|nr:unnamed protein product [Closterium sp. Yama58-4]